MNRVDEIAKEYTENRAILTKGMDKLLARKMAEQVVKEIYEDLVNLYNKWFG